mmetsp:Transcript_36655/g.67197  ORF Transcript_36655/g.67197 Transcript_36655/m.67197 type:complete len:513 (-) Transcript_36655:101-1639(-)
MSGQLNSSDTAQETPQPKRRKAETPSSSTQTNPAFPPSSSTQANPAFLPPSTSTQANRSFLADLVGLEGPPHLLHSDDVHIPVTTTKWDGPTFHACCGTDVQVEAEVNLATRTLVRMKVSAPASFEMVTVCIGRKLFAVSRLDFNRFVKLAGFEQTGFARGIEIAVAAGTFLAACVPGNPSLPPYSAGQGQLEYLAQMLTAPTSAETPRQDAVDLYPKVLASFLSRVNMQPTLAPDEVEQVLQLLFENLPYPEASDIKAHARRGLIVDCLLANYTTLTLSEDIDSIKSLELVRVEEALASPLSHLKQAADQVVKAVEFWCNCKILAKACEELGVRVDDPIFSTHDIYITFVKRSLFQGLSFPAGKRTCIVVNAHYLATGRDFACEWLLAHEKGHQARSQAKPEELTPQTVLVNEDDEKRIQMAAFAKKIRDEDWQPYADQGIQEGGELMELKLIGELWGDEQSSEAVASLQGHLQRWNGEPLPHRLEFEFVGRVSQGSGWAKRRLLKRQGRR